MALPYCLTNPTLRLVRNLAGAGHVCSEETRAKIREAWARRKEAR